MTFAAHVCWTRDGVDDALNTEATQGSNAVFLARHTPVRDFAVLSARELQLSQFTDAGLLGELLEARDYALVLVVGEAGSGKSHLLRWLQLRWPRSHRERGDVVSLVPKSRATLAGALRHLREHLPPEDRAALDRISIEDSALTESGRTEMFSNWLGVLLDEKTAGRNNDTIEWATRHGVKRLLDMAKDVGWQAPGRVLQAYSHAEQKEDRLFAIGDIEALAQQLDGVQFPHNYPGLRELINRIRCERADDADDRESAAKLANVLNQFVPEALRRIVGLGPNDLRNALRQLRRSIKGRGGRLVLLLEDLTDYTGVADDLIEALLARPDQGGNSDICPLIAVVGVTPGYYQRILRELTTFRQRLSLEIGLSGETEGDTTGAARLLRTPADRSAFVARYLNAARLGRLDSETWERQPAGTQVPSACSSCGQREPCHAAFGVATPEGVEEPVGLYPFTEVVIEKMWARVRDPEGTVRSEQTPRGIVQNILTPTLRHGLTDLPAGRYPPAVLDQLPSLPRPRVSTRVRQSLNEAAAGHQDRAERVVAWWGAEDQVAPFQNLGSQPAFAAVPKAVLDAFRIPLAWPSSVAERVPRPIRPPDRVGAEPPPPPTETPRPPSDPAREVMRRHREALLAWLREGTPLPAEEHAYWRRPLFAAIQCIPWTAHSLSPPIMDTLFTDNTVGFRGSAFAERGTAFVVDPGEPGSEWNSGLELGLDAWASLHEIPSDSPEERATLRRAATDLVEQLAPHAVAHARRVLRTAAGIPWSPRVAPATRLKLRTWLGEASSPKRNSVDQWRALVEVSDGDGTNAIRTEAWRALLKRIEHGSEGHSLPEPRKAADRLVEWARLGAGKSEFLIDGWAIWSAAGSAVEQPSGPVPGGLRDAAETARVLADLPNELDQVVRGEHEALRTRAGQIAALTFKRSVGDFVETAERTLHEVFALPRHGGPPLLPADSWEALADARKRLPGSESPKHFRAQFDELERFVGSVLKGEVGALNSASNLEDALDWCLSWPGETSRLQRYVDQLHKQTRETHGRASELMAGGGKSGAGVDPESAANRLRAIAVRLQGKSK